MSVRDDRGHMQRVCAKLRTLEGAQAAEAEFKVRVGWMGTYMWFRWVGRWGCQRVGMWVGHSSTSGYSIILDPCLCNLWPLQISSPSPALSSCGCPRVQQPATILQSGSAPTLL